MLFMRLYASYGFVRYEKHGDFFQVSNHTSRIDQNSMYLLEGLKSKSKSSQGTTSGPLAHGLLQSPWSTRWTLLQDQTCGRFWISPGVTVGCGWDPDPASPAGWAPATKIAGNFSINLVWKPTITRQSSSRRQIDVWIFTVFEEPAQDSQKVTLPWTPSFLGRLVHLGHFWHWVHYHPPRHQAQAASAPELLTARLARLAWQDIEIEGTILGGRTIWPIVERGFL